MPWLSVREAAERLGISEVRVRQLAAAGDLAARRHSNVWLIDENAVAARQEAHPRAGRPVEPDSAWMLLNVLADASRVLLASNLEADRDRLAVARALIALRNDAVRGRNLRESGRALAGLLRNWPVSSPAVGHDPLQGVEEVRARNLRRRLRRGVSTAPRPELWSGWLGGRSERCQYWAHPGVIDRLREDGRLSLGGAWAATLAGADIAPGDQIEAYVREADLDAVVRGYRLREDPDGRVIMRVIPSSVPGALLPQAGQPVAPVVAALDLLESPDARSRSLALSWLGDLAALLSDQETDPGRRDSARGTALAR